MNEENKKIITIERIAPDKYGIKIKIEIPASLFEDIDQESLQEEYEPVVVILENVLTDLATNKLLSSNPAGVEEGNTILINYIYRAIEHMKALDRKE